MSDLISKAKIESVSKNICKDLDKAGLNFLYLLSPKKDEKVPTKFVTNHSPLEALRVLVPCLRNCVYAFNDIDHEFTKDIVAELTNELQNIISPSNFN